MPPRRGRLTYRTLWYRVTTGGYMPEPVTLEIFSDYV
jgi:hypothetical protein